MCLNFKQQISLSALQSNRLPLNLVKNLFGIERMSIINYCNTEKFLYKFNSGTEYRKKPPPLWILKFQSFQFCNQMLLR